MSKREMSTKNKSLCHGCRNDYYNTAEANGCWSFKNARVVRRWRIGWWTQPETADSFDKVITLTCHSAPGQYADYEQLPEHLGGTKP